MPLTPGECIQRDITSRVHNHKCNIATRVILYFLAAFLQDEEGVQVHSTGFLSTSIIFRSGVPSTVPNSGMYSKRDVNGTAARNGEKIREL